MIKFNSDGSIKLPEKVNAQKEEQISRMKTARCIQIRKEIINHKAPKSCALHITLSDKITDSRFIENIYSEFNNNCEVPSKIFRLSDKEFKVEIGSCFTRCSNCTTLIQKYREFLNANLIEKQGSCTFGQNRQNNFSYEDYFD